jgi:DNA uptake protein ComE-like DNA-binding protein
MRSKALIALALVAGSGLCWATSPAQAPAAPKPTQPAAQVKLVDINSASRAQLKSLPGLSAAEIDGIIAGRPYYSKADLATKHVIPTGTYLSLKNRVIARQKPRQKDKKKT